MLFKVFNSSFGITIGFLINLLISWYIILRFFSFHSLCDDCTTFSYLGMLELFGYVCKVYFGQYSTAFISFSVNGLLDRFINYTSCQIRLKMITLCITKIFNLTTLCCFLKAVFLHLYFSRLYMKTPKIHNGVEGAN